MTRLRLVAAAATLALAGACLPYTGGKYDRLTFDDQTVLYEEMVSIQPSATLRPIAVGGVVELLVRPVRGGTGWPVVSVATVDPPGILEVELVSNPVRLRALAPGWTSLTVELAGGVTDLLEIEVAAPASVEHHGLPFEGFGEWLPQPPPGGIALEPGAVLPLGFTLRDAAGRSLTGAGLVPWIAEPEGRLELRLVEGVQAIDFVAGVDFGPVVLAGVPSGELSLLVEPPGSTARLFVAGTPALLVGADGSSLTLRPSDDPLLALLLAADAEGRLLLVGSDPELKVLPEEAFVATVFDAGALFRGLSDYPLLGPPGSLIAFSDVQQGQAILRARLDGAELEIAVDVPEAF